MYTAAQKLTGLSLIAGAINPITVDDFKALPLVVAGYFKDEIRAGLSVRNETEADIDVSYERLIEIARQNVQRIFDMVDADIKREIAEKQQTVKEELKASNAPSEFGTVSEIAAKYGISKSEVRRLKQAGELESFIKEKQ